MKTNGYPLGLMYVASNLRKIGEHAVQILDTKANGLSTEDAIRIIGDYNADYVGISGMTCEAFDIHEMAKKIKEVFPQKKVILGGPHPTTAPAEVIKDPNVDFAVIGEGEETLPRLISAIEAGNDSFTIPGVAYSRNGNSTVNPGQVITRNLDELPFPAWDLIDIEKYFCFTRQSVIYAHPRFMSIFTSRGCPYQCIYCHQVFGKKLRTRSPENVLDEIKLLYEQYGIREFHVADDNFNLDAGRAERICDLIIASGLKIHLSFPNGLRGDIVSLQLLKKLKEAGTFMISYAIESGSPRMQKYLKKNIRFEKMTRIIDETDHLGILCNGFFMIGFPGETKKEIELTLNYAWKSKFHTASFYVVNPFPGTELFTYKKDKIPHQLNEIVDKNYSYLSANYGISDLSDKDLQHYLTKANLKFYFNVRRMLGYFTH
jgi:radical SAM superfamily enzyme YgiQ (UPF0313 family)